MIHSIDQVISDDGSEGRLGWRRMMPLDRNTVYMSQEERDRIKPHPLKGLVILEVGTKDSLNLL
jgi:hypothetical protein